MITGSQKVIAPVGRDVEDRVRAVALLPEEDDRAEDRRQRDQVEQDGLDRQQHRPERPHQQDERDQRDQRQHVRELVVDRAEVVLDGRAGAGDPDRRRRRPPRPRSGRRRRRSLLELSTVSLVGQRRRRRPGPSLLPPTTAELDAVDRRAAASAAASAWSGGDQHLDRGEHAGADAAVAQRLQGVVRRAAAGQRVDAGLADLEAEDRDDEQAERRPAATPAAIQRCRTMSRAHAVQPRDGAAFVPDPRPVDPRPDAGQQRRQQREHDRDADQRDQHAAEAHAAQERHRHDEQREQADRHGDAGGERRRGRRSSSRRRRPPRCCARARAPRASATPAAASSRSRHPSPISAIRNCTTKLTSVNVVSPSTSRKVVRIDTAAISSGTKREERREHEQQHERARPAAPSSVSTSTLGPLGVTAGGQQAVRRQRRARSPAACGRLVERRVELRLDARAEATAAAGPGSARTCVRPSSVTKRRVAGAGEVDDPDLGRLRAAAVEDLGDLGGVLPATVWPSGTVTTAT